MFDNTHVRVFLLLLNQVFGSIGIRVCMQVSRGVHDEKGSAPVLPVNSGTGAEHARRGAIRFLRGILKSMMVVRLFLVKTLCSLTEGCLRLLPQPRDCSR